MNLAPARRTCYYHAYYFVSRAAVRSQFPRPCPYTIREILISGRDIAHSESRVLAECWAQATAVGARHGMRCEVIKPFLIDMD